MTDGSTSPANREGDRPRNGFGEQNRFETLADGTTPVGQGQPAVAPAAEPAGPVEPGHRFPTYPYGTEDPAQVAFREYQAQQALQPTPPYRATPNPYQPPATSSPYATVSLVLGVLSIACWVTGPIALGFGIAALRQVNAAPLRTSGRGSAIAGIVTGAIGTMFLLLILLGRLAG